MSSSNSNLERFLDCTTPSVPVQPVQKEECVGEIKQWRSFDEGSPRYFRLGDLWDCYDEWSAYGAGVPIHLNGNETVVQYYVPYLSAIQIYTNSSINRSLSDGECSEYELRDSSSNGETESDNSNYSEKSVSWDGCGFEDLGGGEQESSWRSQDRLGCPYLEYFEHCPPYARVPLMEKINQLRRVYPELHNLRSIDLCPASWMSVAWYPIYHIPTSRSVRDLSACFLTYHTLSFSFQDNDNLTEKGYRNKEWADCIRLTPFGAATYKLNGGVWFPGGDEGYDRLYALWSSALSWLNQLQLHHPDFRFFLGHRD